jgi:hypothetical protein
LILVIFLSGLFLTLGVILLKMVYNDRVAAGGFCDREQAFWLAEAGLEKGKVELVENSNWYTDLPHYPEDDFKWLKEGAVGQKAKMGGGGVKIIREKGVNRLYALGFRSKAVVILKIKITPPPLKVLSWEEL